MREIPSKATEHRADYIDKLHEAARNMLTTVDVLSTKVHEISNYFAQREKNQKPF